MRLFHSLSVLKARFPVLSGATKPARRWQAARDHDPALARDIIRIGGLLTLSAQRFSRGREVLDPLCPIRMARDAGRRDLAIELLALMDVKISEIHQEMETEHEN